MTSIHQNDSSRYTKTQDIQENTREPMQVNTPTSIENLVSQNTWTGVSLVSSLPPSPHLWLLPRLLLSDANHLMLPVAIHHDISGGALTRLGQTPAAAAAAAHVCNLINM